MEQIIYDEVCGLTGVKEIHAIDVKEGKRHRRLTMETQDILDFCHHKRMEEGSKGNRFGNLLRKRKWKQTACVPTILYMHYQMWKMDKGDQVKFIQEKFPKFLTTNARF